MNGNNLYLDNITISGACNTSTTPVAMITPGGPTTFCQGDSVALTASGGTGYLWSNDATTATIYVTAGGTYTVTVTNEGGCFDDESIGIDVLPASEVSVSVSASANPVYQGAEVTFTASPVNEGLTPVYTWFVNGSLAGSATGDMFSYIPIDQDAVHCVLFSDETCTVNNPATSNILVISVIQVPDDTTVHGTISSGQSDCFSAIQTITIAGNNLYFIVDDGGSAVMISGGNIRYLPGTKVVQGGAMHGFITQDHQFCPPPAKSAERGGQVAEGGRGEAEENVFMVYPNPTSGDFFIRHARKMKPLKGSAGIFSMQGKMILHQDLAGEESCRCRFSGFPAGMYIIRILEGSHIETKILVKSAE
jgi:hypothetical protein